MASPSSRIITTSYSCEMRPRLLKDFLLDDSSAPSCSFDGFIKKTSSHKYSHSRLLRSRSKSASISISAIHKASEVVMKAIKFFPFASSIVKSTPSLLPRSISRKKSRRDRNGDCSHVLGVQASVSTDHDHQVTPKIKDILRWKSFRDVVEELSTSWLETDFTPQDLNSLGNDDPENYYFVDHHQKNKMEGRNFSFDEKEQQSPVSVLNDSPFRDDHEADPILYFNLTAATVERRKSMLMQRIAEFEALAKLEPFAHQGLFTKEEEKSIPKEEEETNSEVEARARQLFDHVKPTSSSTKNHNYSVPDADNIVLFDFFRHELANIANKNQKDVELSEREMLKMAEAWMSREYCEGTFDSELLDNREACIRDMETGPIGWMSNNFNEEQQELGRDLEIQVFNNLLDELCADLYPVTEQKK